MHRIRKETMLSLLYPARCILCDALLPFPESGICRSCREKEIYLLGRKCMKCGRKLQDGQQEYCHDCGEQPHFFTRGIALYEYEAVAPALYRLKYQNRKNLAAAFGEEIAFYLGDQIRSFHAQAILPVPMYPRKQKKRGYNQAQLLARRVGRELSLPVLPDFVVRSQNTPPLKELNPKERRNYLKNAFHISPNGVKLKRIIIMDDIYTTGSTMDAISLVLRENGVEEIYVVALAIGSGV